MATTTGPLPSCVTTLTHKLLNLLKTCYSLKSFKQIHTQMLITSIHKDNYLLSKLVELKDYSYSCLLFSQIPKPNDFSYNIMIRGLTNTWKQFSLALQFYYQMKFVGIQPNNFTYPFILISCANLPSLNHGRTAHSSIIKIGLHTDSHVVHSLITMYSRCGQLDFARIVFDEILDRDLVSWNSMISGYSKMGFAAEAVGLFRRMRVAGYQPNEMTLVSVLSACGDLGDLSLGRWVEDFIEENEVKLNSFVGSALVDMYGKCGDLESARRVFDCLPTKDLVAWNAIITGYAQNGESSKAITQYHDMRKASMDPDKITLISVLSACASIGALDVGSSISVYASQKGLHHDIYVGTVLIDMFAKCGKIDHAFKIFEEMPQRNIVSWNTMISAFSFNGRAKDAMSLFERMLKEDGGGIRPDGITFIGVLSACVHAGLIDEGRRWFKMMEQAYGLLPKIEHYACMVDLLARAGHLQQALDVIEKMPEKPDAVILGALLVACKNFGNVDVGERVMDLLVELEPSNSGNYMISSKMYANSKNWDKSAKMRGLMRQRGVTKTPGCSWIEIEDKVCEFHAGNGLHDREREMEGVVSLLSQDMKREGYILTTDI